MISRVGSCELFEVSEQSITKLQVLLAIKALCEAWVKIETKLLKRHCCKEKK